MIKNLFIIVALAITYLIVLIIFNHLNLGDFPNIVISTLLLGIIAKIYLKSIAYEAILFAVIFAVYFVLNDRLLLLVMSVSYLLGIFFTKLFLQYKRNFSTESRAIFLNKMSLKK
ncbi:hypothetical protein [Acinetobacter gerneri]|uniref:Uncharacterized protein n=1 Tax=Acinetobacter gerneri DSM 14967 = CIP 107464 = MTCC 9824 TaxID=1120926 RepID=N8YFW4_9GAMM|nr:hypothetical protein [Acinetobacter gerneri]ENV35551.1 hypothetical protein F960_00233 [Acinetobacter gerneri DSM 14967 = CIP 107464 = MTCC 9824]